MAAIQELIRNERKEFSARGTLVSLYVDSHIFHISGMLDAILKRWSVDDVPYLDIEPASFNFLIDYCKLMKEYQAIPSNLNNLLMKDFDEKFLKNPQYIFGAKYLEMDIKLLEYLEKDHWNCQDPQVASLNECVKDKKWHYVDGFVYLAFMLKEKDERFNDLRIIQKIGSGTSKSTISNCISLRFCWPIYNRPVEPGMKPSPQQIEEWEGWCDEEDKLVFGQEYPNYSRSYITLEEIKMSIDRLKHPRSKELCEKILNYMPGCNNTLLRKR
jgi:hypothetical protein